MKRSRIEIPEFDPDGAGGGRRQRGRRRRREDRERRRALGVATWLDFGPRPIPFVESRPAEETGTIEMFRPKRRRIELGAVLAGVFGLVALVLVAAFGYQATRVSVEQEGLEDGAALNPAQVAATEVRFEFESPDQADGATLAFNGEPVEDAELRGELLLWSLPAELEDGEHVVELAVPRRLIGDATLTWEFTVDSTPPELTVPAVRDPVDLDEAVVVAGRVEPGARLRADGQEVDVDGDGEFSLRFTRPPAGPIRFEATDPAGNTNVASTVVPVTYPGASAVHVTAPAWASESFRSAILALVDQGRIDTVELTLKDEGGVVGYDSDVALAHELGAVTPFFDLSEAVALLEERGARVVGRIAAFRDPIHARAAWSAGETAKVLQTSDGRPWAEPGQYTNFADASVRQYNIDIALEAVARGVGDILWDDVGIPIGSATSILVPGVASEPEDAVVGFLAEAHGQLRRRGAYQGVAAAGSSADQGFLRAQDVPRMARNADYVVAEVFPADWGRGHFGLENPAAQPGELAGRLVERYLEVMEDSGAVLAPALQDFSRGGVAYGEAEVRAQIAAARAAGVDSFLLWDPQVRYTAGALDPLG